ncbi:unnamed protein product, partial [Rotaria magnacalcarata]
MEGTDNSSDEKDQIKTLQLPIIFTEFSDQARKDFLVQVIRVKNLQDIPSPCLESKYFQAVLNHIQPLSNEECRSILTQFKQSLFDSIREQRLQIEEEKELWHFIEQFFSIYEVHQVSAEGQSRWIDYLLSRSQALSPTDLIEYLLAELTLPKWLEKKSMTSKRLELITEYIQELKSKLIELRQYASSNSFIESIKQQIAYHLTPVTYAVTTIESRTILVVKSVHLVLSDCVSKLEEQLKKSNAVEVQLIAGENLFIDCVLKGLTWHGKNIAIRAKEIQVVRTSSIDVSGLDGESRTKPTAAKDSQQDRSDAEKNGQHGTN